MAETDARRSEDLTEEERFEEPRLKFVEPEVVEAGELTKATGFFGTFSP